MSKELKLTKIDENKLRKIGFTDYNEPYCDVGKMRVESIVKNMS